MRFGRGTYERSRRRHGPPTAPPPCRKAKAIPATPLQPHTRGLSRQSGAGARSKGESVLLYTPPAATKHRPSYAKPIPVCLHHPHPEGSWVLAGRGAERRSNGSTQAPERPAPLQKSESNPRAWLQPHTRGPSRPSAAGARSKDRRVLLYTRPAATKHRPSCAKPIPVCLHHPHPEGSWVPAGRGAERRSNGSTQAPDRPAPLQKSESNPRAWLQPHTRGLSRQSGAGARSKGESVLLYTPPAATKHQRRSGRQAVYGLPATMAKTRCGTRSVSSGQVSASIAACSASKAALASGGSTVMPAQARTRPRQASWV